MVSCTTKLQPQIGYGEVMAIKPLSQFQQLITNRTLGTDHSCNLRGGQRTVTICDGVCVITDYYWRGSFYSQKSGNFSLALSLWSRTKELSPGTQTMDTGQRGQAFAQGVGRGNRCRAVCMCSACYCWALPVIWLQSTMLLHPDQKLW